MEDAWLLVKRDLYYRPNGEGYTGIRDNAGRYPYEEAKKHCYDSGPDGNSVTMVRVDEAPEFTRACFDDLARDHLRKQRDDLRAVLGATHKLIIEGALVGFIPTEGTWADRLYANNGAIHDVLITK